jgi:hypothetical protein
MAEAVEGGHRDNRGDHAEDITADLDRLCNRLAPGELAHSHAFTLSEAMSAVELLNPKMDADSAISARPSDPPTAPPRLRPHQLAAIADGLLACEATWHQGFSLAQTLLTCLYLHQPSLACGTDPPAPLLEAFVRFSAAVVHAVHSVIIRADIYEEEDYVANLYDFSFQSHENGPLKKSREHRTAFTLFA